MKRSPRPRVVVSLTRPATDVAPEDMQAMLMAREVVRDLLQRGGIEDRVLRGCRELDRLAADRSVQKRNQMHSARLRKHRGNPAPLRATPKKDEQELQVVMIVLLSELRRAGAPLLAFHVPNEGKRSRMEAATLKRMGLVRSVPDLVILLPSRSVLLVEVKSATGKTDSDQDLLHEAANRIGHPVEVVRDTAGLLSVVCSRLLDAGFDVSRWAETDAAIPTHTP